MSQNQPTKQNDKKVCGQNRSLLHDPPACTTEPLERAAVVLPNSACAATGKPGGWPLEHSRPMDCRRGPLAGYVSDRQACRSTQVFALICSVPIRWDTFATRCPSYYPDEANTKTPLSLWTREGLGRQLYRRLPPDPRSQAIHGPRACAQPFVSPELHGRDHSARYGTDILKKPTYMKNLFLNCCTDFSPSMQKHCLEPEKNMTIKAILIRYGRVLILKPMDWALRCPWNRALKHFGYTSRESGSVANFFGSFVLLADFCDMVLQTRLTGRVY